MPDYKLGKIYKIYCNVTGEVYVGSTTEKTLARRLASHVGHYKRFSNGIKTPAVASFNIIGRGDYYIDLLENCSCNNRDELIKKEREWLSYKRQKEKGFTEKQKAKINENSLNNYYNHQEDYNKKAIERYKKKSQEKETCNICGRTYQIT
eukprot:gene17082-35375_t